MAISGVSIASTYIHQAQMRQAQPKVDEAKQLEARQASQRTQSVDIARKSSQQAVARSNEARTVGSTVDTYA